MKNKRMLVTLLSAAAVVITTGCATSKMSSAPMASQVRHSVSVIALAPGGGMLTDAVGIELANHGFTIIDPSSTSNMMVRLNLNEVEISRPEGLAKLDNINISSRMENAWPKADYSTPISAESANLIANH